MELMWMELTVLETKFDKSGKTIIFRMLDREIPKIDANLSTYFKYPEAGRLILPLEDAFRKITESDDSLLDAERNARI